MGVISNAEKAAVDLLVLKEVIISEWRKEDELRKLKVGLSGLERKIQLSLSDKNSKREENEGIQLKNNSGTENSVAITLKVEQRFKVS